MKKIKSVLLVTALGALFTGSAFADGQAGQLTFNGVVDAGTCVLSGQDISHDFGPISKGAWATTTSGVFHSPTEDTIKVSDCSAGVKNVIVTTAFTPYGDGSGRHVKNDGTATGVVITMRRSTASFNLVDSYSPAQVQTFAVDPVTKGVDIPVYTNYGRNLNDAVTSGSLQYNATFQFAYE